VYYERSPCRVFVPKKEDKINTVSSGFTAYHSTPAILFVSLFQNMRRGDADTEQVFIKAAVLRLATPGREEKGASLLLLTIMGFNSIIHFMVRAKKDLEVAAKTLPEDRVHLPSLFGIAPRIYLALLYSCVLLVILFFILFYPGIRSPGTVFVITSEPQGAAVRINDVYYERTPCRVFVPKGEHKISVVSPGFTTYHTEVQVKGRLFASLLFPLTVALNTHLSAPDPVAILKDQASEYAAWAFAGEPTVTYQVPQSLSEGVYRIGRADEPVFEDILKSAARFATTKTAVRDLSRAQFLLDNAGNAPSPVTALHSVQEMLSWLSETPHAAQWLASVLPADMAETLAASEWFNNQNTEEGVLTASLSGRQMTVEALVFQEVQASAGSPWWVAEKMVTIEEWDAFLRANPQWAPENTENLYAQGLVDTDYLERFGGTAVAGTSAVTGVSWYAAQAYCQWLTMLLPPEQGLVVRLPTEAEWKLSPPLDGEGDLWEWCDDFFAPIDFLPAPVVIESPEKVLRSSGTKFSSTENRGSLPPEFCSPFVSFRPVIVQEGV
jgi:formylglycine-generating enzyme required for sulfatase activity